MKKNVLVIIEKTIEVEVDEEKFDDEFMDEFRQLFYKFDTLDDHIEHLAQLVARGYAGKWSPHERGEFIEGYGHVKDMGIHLKEIDEYWSTGEA